MTLMPNGWIFNAPTQEWWYWYQGEAIAKVSLEAWDAYAHSRGWR